MAMHNSEFPLRVLKGSVICSVALSLQQQQQRGETLSLQKKKKKERSAFCLDKSSLQLIGALGVDGSRAVDQKASAPNSETCNI